jgi:hypothetical protein
MCLLLRSLIFCSGAVKAIAHGLSPPGSIPPISSTVPTSLIRERQAQQTLPFLGVQRRLALAALTRFKPFALEPSLERKRN